MANTTPISNALNIDLSNKLNDRPTAGADDGITAATNGTVFSASQRNYALAQAYNQLAVRLINNFGPDGAAARCEGIVGLQTCTFTSTVTLNKDFVAPLRLVTTSTQEEFLYRPRGVLANDQDIRIGRGYAIEGGILYAYIRTTGVMTLQTTGSASLYYLKSDRKDTTTGAPIAVNTAPDTTIDQTWLIWCLEYAAWWLSEMKGTGRWKEKAQEYFVNFQEKLPNAKR